MEMGKSKRKLSALKTENRSRSRYHIGGIVRFDQEMKPYFENANKNVKAFQGEGKKLCNLL